MSNFKKKHPIPEQGQMVEVTARHCSDKVRTSVEVGKSYIVYGVDALADGTPVLNVHHPKKKKALLRINAARFDWQILTPEMVAEREQQAVWDENNERIKNDFTQQEQIRICFIPLIIETLIWHYADECQQYGREHRLDVLKKLSRAVTHIRQEYNTFVGQSLDNAHKEQVRTETERFITECGNDFTIMYFTMRREYMKIQPESDIADLAAKAIIGMLLVRFLDAWNKKIDGLISERMGKVTGSIRTPTMDKLYACFDAYAGHIEGFDWKNPDISFCMTILNRKINMIEFEVGAD